MSGVRPVGNWQCLPQSVSLCPHKCVSVSVFYPTHHPPPSQSQVMFPGPRHKGCQGSVLRAEKGEREWGVEEEEERKGRGKGRCSRVIDSPVDGVCTSEAPGRADGALEVMV